MTKVTRKTTESTITVTLTPPPVAADYRAKIDTPISFLNHMIEHIVWRSGLNIEISVQLADFALSHLICEDVGITVGRAIAAYMEDLNTTGYGDGVGIIDEAMALAAVSFESRPRFVFSSEAVLTEETEDMHTEDLQVFLDGLAIGAAMTLHVDIRRGENSHHIWEAVYRAVGIALGHATLDNPQRRAMTAGVAGKIQFTTEK